MITKEEVAIRLGMDLSQLKQQSAVGGMIIESSLGKTLKSLRRMFAINFFGIGLDIVTRLGGMIGEGLGKLVFNTRINENLKTRADLFRNARLEREAEAKKAKEDAAEQLKANEKIADVQDKLIEASRQASIERKKLSGVNELKEKLKFAEVEESLAKNELTLTQSKLDRLKITEAELRLEEASLKVAQLRNQIEASGINAKHNKAQDILESGKFSGTVSQIAALEAAAAQNTAMGDRFGFRNVFRSSDASSTRERVMTQFDIRAMAQRRAAGALRASIAGQMNQMLQQAMTPEQRIMSQILQAIAPEATSSGIPVVVKNVSND